jgi:hypothetical protein
MLDEMAAKLPVSSLRYDCKGCGESTGIDRNYGAYCELGFSTPKPASLQ